MTNRPLLLLFLIPVLLVQLGCESAPQSDTEASPAPPNIVLILADDMGYGDPGSFNPDSKIPTPHIDRLADEGMKFTDAHSPSAVCTPTRYALLTGRYSWRSPLKSGVLQGYSASLIDTTRLTLASMLKQAGYATGGVGKWHLGLQTTEPTDYTQPMRPGPVSLGFDYYFGIPASLDMEPYLYFENDRVVEQPTDSIADSRPCCVGPFFRGGPIAPSFRHIDVLPDFTDKAVAYIEQQAASESPFFLYVPLAAPHTPWFPTEEFIGKTEAGEYGDFTMMVDWTVGQILEALDRLSLSENTLVVFTSDNGPYWTQVEKDQYGHLSQGTWRGMKADIWEGGHRVPLVARWPGVISAGSVSDQVFSHTDFMATFAAVAGVELPADAGEDSYDMTPAFRGEATGPIRNATIHHSANGMFAIRQGDWKLIAGRGSGGFTEPRTLTPGPGEPEGQLYNLADDPGETTNLYRQHPDVVERLSALLAETQQDQDPAFGSEGFMK